MDAADALMPRALGRLRRVWWGGLYLIVVVGVLFALLAHRAYDDPFITYRYTANLRDGLGFVYNPGERVLSTTTPGFALLLALLGGVWPYLPALANFIGALGVAAGGLLLWDLGESWDAPWVGWAGLLLYPTFPLLLSTLGSETPLYLALILAAYALYARGNLGLTALLGALAILTRADAVIPLAILGIHYLWSNRHRLPDTDFWRNLPWGWFALAAGILLAWHAFAWAYFGNPLPVTLAAKQAQGRMAISQGFAPGFLRVAGWYRRGWYAWVELALALLGLAWALMRARRWLLFLLWPLLYFLAYTLLGVTRYFWYYAPLVPGWIVAVGLGLTAISSQQSAGSGISSVLRLPSSVLLALVLAIFLAQGRGVLKMSRANDPRFAVYRAVGEYLAENTPPDARVGALEIGVIGYFSRRSMVDFAGLLQPPVADQMSAETTYDDTAIWAVQTYQPDYLALTDSALPRLERDLVAEHCSPVAIFRSWQNPAAPQMHVYACRW